MPAAASREAEGVQTRSSAYVSDGRKTDNENARSLGE